MKVDKKLLIVLNSQVKIFINFLEIQNQNHSLILDLNSRLEIKPEKGLLKTQYFVLSDLINIFQAFGKDRNVNSSFILAYYYDALRNNHFPDEESYVQINHLINDTTFEETTSKIIKENKLTKKNSLDSVYFFDIIYNSNNQIFTLYNIFFEFCYSFQFSSVEKLREKINLIIESTETLQDVLAELNNLIGLKNIKSDINELVNFIKVSDIRKRQKLKTIELTLHSVFLGPPGTGKTTVARLISKIFKHLGYLSKGHLNETDREDLIAGYVGQTAMKVNELVKNSLGGILFIDEAYSLTQNLNSSDFGSEAINTLLKRMEDERSDFVVIVAGYNDLMLEFINSNPGLKSRFNRYFYFEHFSTVELVEIFESFCKKNEFILNSESKEKVQYLLEILFDNKTENFGNARVVRNLFEDCVKNQANRIVNKKNPSIKYLKTLTELDIPDPVLYSKNLTNLN